MTDDRRCPWSHAIDDLYRRAGCSPDEVEGVGWLALRLLGETSLDYACSDQVEPVRLLEGPWRILLSPDLEDEELTMAIARALALWWLAMTATRAPSASELASLAAAIAVPFEKLEREMDQGGDDDDLAAVFVVPANVVTERIGSLAPRRRSGLRSRLTEAS